MTMTAPSPEIDASDVGPCVCCGAVGLRPEFEPVLRTELVEEWDLSPEEAARLDRREGESCSSCGVDMRSASLARAILQSYGWPGTFEEWVASEPQHRVLEIDKAGQLTPWLERISGHTLVESPAVDMQSLPFEDGTWDLVIHSDKLEHVDDPVQALQECRRMLAPYGRLCFTIPVMPDRLSRRRDGLSPSYHGHLGEQAARVVTEYGADFWGQVLDAGFEVIGIVSHGWPNACAIVAMEHPVPPPAAEPVVEEAIEIVAPVEEAPAEIEGDSTESVVHESDTWADRMSRFAASEDRLDHSERAASSDDAQEGAEAESHDDGVPELAARTRYAMNGVRVTPEQEAPLARLWNVTKVLAWTDFKLRYAGSALGYFWSVSKPLLLFGVLYGVFTRVLRFGEGIPHYPVLLLFAIVLWSYFTEVTNGSVTVLVARADVLRKISIPRIALPLSLSLTGAIVMMFNMLAVVAFAVINDVPIQTQWLLISLLILELFILTVGVSLILSVCYVSLRDIGQVWELILQVLFYATPIIYPLTLIPEDIRPIILASPVAQIVQQSREIVVGSGVGSYAEAMPGVLYFLPYVITATIFGLGIVLFNRTAPSVAERL